MNILQTFVIRDYNKQIEADKLPSWETRLRIKMKRAAKRDAITTTFKPNGKREVARRLRQIAAGQLKVTPAVGVRELVS